MNYLLSVGVPTFIFVLVGAGALLCFVLAFFSGKSGSTQQVGTGTTGSRKTEVSGNTPNKGLLIWGGLLTLVFIFLIFYSKWES